MKSQNTPCVLLVDDDPEMVASASTLLKRDGVAVITAVNKTEAAARMSLDKFDLILLDLSLPDEEDGFGSSSKSRKARQPDGFQSSC